MAEKPKRKGDPKKPRSPTRNVLERRFYEWNVYEAERHNLVVQASFNLEMKRKFGKEYTV